MRWDAGLGDGGLDARSPVLSANGGLEVQVVDVFCEQRINVCLYLFLTTWPTGTFTLQTSVQDNPNGIAASLVAMGLIPSAPYHPCLAVSTCLMKLFNTLHLHSPPSVCTSFHEGAVWPSCHPLSAIPLLPVPYMLWHVYSNQEWCSVAGFCCPETWGRLEVMQCMSSMHIQAWGWGCACFWHTCHHRWQQLSETDSLQGDNIWQRGPTYLQINWMARGQGDFGWLLPELQACG